MSLTSFLKNSAAVRERFKAEFLMPPLTAKGELLAKPVTDQHSLVGTAFDYLLRFHLQRLNPKAKTRAWNAEDILLNDPAAKDECYCYEKRRSILEKAIKDHKRFLLSGEIDGRILRTTLRLAKLDVLFRREVGDSFYETLEKTDKKDVEDLRRLISLVNPKDFTAKNICSLNPIFGRASKLVRGADADIIIDDALIEIKTSKYLRVERSHFNQLIGYYTLSRIGGITGLPKNYSIKRLGIYFSRYGHLWLFKVSDVVDEKRMGRFINWFKKRAKEEFCFE